MLLLFPTPGLRLPNQWHVEVLGVEKEVGGDVHGDAYRGFGTLGSRPPSCDRKCGGCSPCTAIQVPATMNQQRTQYANYEPEGWKCKCGSSIYNP
ncbi:EPIDERMAL PATTERNING FACTOR-like protein 6 isoform X2 [Canna indica]|uniref:Epidermal patterning factor-like protein n=1 Tax=Canna indica TaxID=4628 RepID=A0AAQ3QD21_9LILI|nr:EPIDERMAL PATTERNING FACTOR-like protein 6 isoform X2 [Canna indica]